MTAMIGVDALEGAIGMREAIDLLERTIAHEEAGRTSVSPKFVTEFENGVMRMLFAADPEAGYCAMKAYHNVKNAGTRYVVMLYSTGDGELLAILDGRLITDLRTGAVSGVIARKVDILGRVTVGILGSGNQARTQLEALASVYAVQRAEVYSPTQANRERYAREMSEKLGVDVVAVASAEAAVTGKAVVATASNARGAEPILRREWLDRCRLLCAVGNTRPTFAEVDTDTFAHAACTIMDSRHAITEAGDLVAAVKAGALPESKQATLGQVLTGSRSVPKDGLVIFKSVGMALQDLALAGRYYELLGARKDLASPSNVASLRDRGPRPALSLCRVLQSQ
jgi:ornithine cyclodeaminase/alanine dehydrogenase-like protein (mu-crystallin family)